MLEQLNSLPMFLIAGGAVAFVIFLCVVFIVRSWRAGVAMGIDLSLIHISEPTRP